jgi:hypothetical protein
LCLPFQFQVFKPLSYTVTKKVVGVFCLSCAFIGHRRKVLLPNQSTVSALEIVILFLFLFVGFRCDNYSSAIAFFPYKVPEVLTNSNSSKSYKDIFMALASGKVIPSITTARDSPFLIWEIPLQ